MKWLYCLLFPVPVNQYLRATNEYFTYNHNLKVRFNSYIFIYTLFDVDIYLPPDHNRYFHNKELILTTPPKHHTQITRNAAINSQQSAKQAR